MDYSNLDFVISTMYGVISGPVGQDRDWNRLRSLYHADARLIIAISAPDPPPRLRVLTVDDFIRRVASIFAKEPFWERETGREVENFGRIAHVLSHYESLRDPDGTPFTAGRKSMQLFFDDKRWWILSAMWNTERPE